MSVDWGRVLAELEQERAALELEIAAARRRVDAQRVTPPAPNGKNGTPRGRTGRVTPERWAEARIAWSRGDTAQAIAKALKVHPTAVYQHAKHWPKRGARAGVELPGRVHCPKCQSMTGRDPCEHCGKKVRQ